MRNVSICLIVLISLLFLLINLYGLLEILRYFKLKQLRELEDEKDERDWHTERVKVPRPPVRVSFPKWNIETTTHRHRIHHHHTTKRIEYEIPSEVPSEEPRQRTNQVQTIGTRIHITTPGADPTTREWTEATTSTKVQTTTTAVPTTRRSWFGWTTRGRQPETSTTTPTPPPTTRMTWPARLPGHDRTRPAPTRAPYWPTHDQRTRPQRPTQETTTWRPRPRTTTTTLAGPPVPHWFVGPMVVDRRRTTTTSEQPTTTVPPSTTSTVRVTTSTAPSSTMPTRGRILITTNSIQTPGWIPSRTRIEVYRPSLVTEPDTTLQTLEQTTTTKEQTTSPVPESTTTHVTTHETTTELREQTTTENELVQETEDNHIFSDYDDSALDDPSDLTEEKDHPEELDHPLEKDDSSTTTTTQAPYHIEGDWRIGRGRNRGETSTTTTTQAPPTNDEVTIVTALLDIGRGDWWEYRRPLEKYHEFMENLLALRNNMIIFTDRSSYDFVHKYRKNMGLMAQTKIHLITIDDLPLSRHLPYAQKIIEDEHKNEEMYKHDPSMKHHPEAKSAEYDVVVNSKTYFLYNSTLDDPFGTDFFVWIDAGYGHGNQSVYPYDGEWKPQFPRGTISMIKLTPERDPIKRYKIDNLYRHNWSVVSGGFIAGDKRTIGQLYTVVHNKFVQLIYQNKVDDDQTVMVLAINSYPHLFSIRHGDWFDAFRMFSSDQERQFGR